MFIDFTASYDTVLHRGLTCKSAPDLDGGGPGAQVRWEAPCADIQSLGRGWPMKSLLFKRIINISDVIL